MAFRKSPVTRSPANDHRPQISAVSPAAAIPGGDFQIRGAGLANGDRPRIHFGKMPAQIVVGSDAFVIARVPSGAAPGEMSLGADPETCVTFPCRVGVQIASGLHPVSNPVVDHAGNIFVTFSGPAGHKTPVSVFKIDPSLTSKPLVTDVLNATGLAIDDDEILYVSSRSDGLVYQVSPAGNTSTYVEGMGVATGMVFDREGNLYVGDRSGTIFKISRQRQIYVFATLEPSLAAYHLALGPDDYLYVTGPTTSSFDSIARISRDGHVERFYRGLAVPRVWRSTSKGIYTWPRLSVAAAASCVSRPRLTRNCSSPGHPSSDWRSRRRRASSWLLTNPRLPADRKVRCIASASALKAARRTNPHHARRPHPRRGNHRRGVGNADLAAPGHQFAVHHRSAQHAGRRGAAQAGGGRRSSDSHRRRPARAAEASRS